MILKVDIEKVYDTLEWKVILATLTRMGFPKILVSWIKACISSASFSFIINGHTSKWIRSYRGIRQGDHISPNFFILVAQNLTSILNYSLRMNLVPGFDLRMSRNFNNMMYGDDLIIVTKSSRSVARNYLFCFNFYMSLIVKKPNPTKLTVFFPSWALFLSSALGCLCSPSACLLLIVISLLKELLIPLLPGTKAGCLLLVRLS